MFRIFLFSSLFDNIHFIQINEDFSDSVVENEASLNSKFINSASLQPVSNTYSTRRRVVSSQYGISRSVEITRVDSKQNILDTRNHLPSAFLHYKAQRQQSEVHAIQIISAMQPGELVWRGWDLLFFLNPKGLVFGIPPKRARVAYCKKKGHTGVELAGILVTIRRPSFYNYSICSVSVALRSFC